MKIEFKKELEDRTRWFVLSGEIDSSFADKVAYGDDGRPLRFVDFFEEPSGKFGVFEGSKEDYAHVKRIEQNPVLITEMFDDVFDSEVPGGYIGKAILGNFDALGITEYSDFITKYENSKNNKDIAAEARQVQRLLEKKKGWKPVTDLPALLVEKNPGAGKKIEKTKLEKEEETAKNGESILSSKWFWIAGASLVGVIALFGGSRKTRTEYEEEE